MNSQNSVSRGGAISSNAWQIVRKLAEKGNILPAGQSAGKLALRAEQGAKPGTYLWTVRGRYTFNGRGDLTQEMPLKVNVLAPEKKQ